MSQAGRWIGVGAALVAVAALAVGAFAAAPAAPVAKTWPMRQDGTDTVVEAPHYRVRTDLGPDVAQTVASHQEALFDDLYRRMSMIKMPQAFERFEILVVGSEKEYLKRLGKAAVHSQGIYMPAQHVLAAWCTKAKLDVILSVLRHEGTHQFMHVFFGASLPVWLNEGMACFYEQADFVDGTLDLNHVDPARLDVIKKAIAGNQSIPVGTMLNYTPAQWSKNNAATGEIGGIEYAEAWSMVHFLAFGESGKYRPHLEQYILQVSQGRPSLDAFAAAFGVNPAVFESRWRDYVANLKPSTSMTCRNHLRLLAQILASFTAKPSLYADMETFRRSLLAGRMGQWKVVGPDGATVSTTDPKVVAELFRCPLDKRPGAEFSYEFLPQGQGEAPIICCRYHSGVVLEAIGEKDGQGKVMVHVTAVPASAAATR